jgi:CspA family cold shock protein
MGERERVTGAVKFFDEKKGWGFITREGGDVFIHASDLPEGRDTLFEGEKVSFEVVNGKKGKGKRAVNLELIA